jgi:molybdopterin molybdotransferase
MDRVLAQDILADRDMPPHALSAMDGFAARKCDLDDPLKVIETIPAGTRPTKPVGGGECSRIMTGAVVPDGADTVVMFEHTEEENGVVRILKKDTNANIRYGGEDLKAGDKVLSAGARITPVEIAVLASVGCDPVPVSRRPRVGVIAKGNELVEPSVTPNAAQIRNSNAYQLCGQVRRAGCDPRYLGIARDTPEAVEATLKKALQQSDVVLLSGGVSAGDFDFVPSILRKSNIDLKFEKVAVKPGKPTVFGVLDNQWFFGLPGNPVSTFVLFEMLVKPFLLALMGCRWEPWRVRARIAGGARRRKADRTEFRPVRLGPDGQATVADYHGSAHIHAYTNANGVVTMRAGETELGDGAEVEVILIL